VRKRNRRLFSVKEELLKKSREAALAAVQIFNNPNITFKAETYVVLMIIAWTYLLHAYYREKDIDYRYFRQGKKRRVFDKTKHGAFKRWELERCLNDKSCPLDRPVAQNLRFMIGLRHEIEHQMTTRIDDLLSARFQACCINFDEAIVGLFGDRYGISKHLAFSLQFSSLAREQVDSFREHPGLPHSVRTYIKGFDGGLDSEDFASAQFAYRVIFVPKTVNHPNQADQVITFIRSDSTLAESVNATYAALRETEKHKWLPSHIVEKVRQEGFRGFRMHEHTKLWKAKDAKDPSRGYGVQVANAWYWYDSWLDEVLDHCKANAESYRA